MCAAAPAGGRRRPGSACARASSSADARVGDCGDVDVVPAGAQHRLVGAAGAGLRSPRSPSTARRRRSSSASCASSRSSSSSMSAIASVLQKPMMFAVSARPWLPRVPRRVCPARVTRSPRPSRSAASSTHSALRGGVGDVARTHRLNGRVLEHAACRRSARRVRWRGRRCGAWTGTPSNVSRPRSCSGSIARGELLAAAPPARAAAGRCRRGRSRSRSATGLLGRDVDELGEERQLVGGHPGRGADLPAHVVQVLRHPAGTAGRSDARSSTQLGYGAPAADTAPAWSSSRQVEQLGVGLVVGGEERRRLR